MQERVASLEDTSLGHEARIRLLEMLAERQQTLLERQDELLEEARRDSAQTRRLWVRLAQRHGWKTTI